MKSSIQIIALVERERDYGFEGQRFGMTFGGSLNSSCFYMKDKRLSKQEAEKNLKRLTEAAARRTSYGTNLQDVFLSVLNMSITASYVIPHS